ncbi:MAG: hypothetical protein JRI25_06630 [Deltaproteobacteria bacterium]|nr:hypothetical protein [Deltaproteobacteria bacterium]
MPKSTARYRFEFRVHDWAVSTSRALCGRRTGFFIGMRDDASLRRIYFPRPGRAFSGDRKNAMAEAHPVWLLYAPYEEPGSAYLEWFNLDRSIVERWLEGKLGPEDFLDVRNTESREDWPPTWRVIVG